MKRLDRNTLTIYTTLYHTYKLYIVKDTFRSQVITAFEMWKENKILNKM